MNLEKLEKEINKLDVIDQQIIGTSFKRGIEVVDIVNMHSSMDNEIYERELHLNNYHTIHEKRSEKTGEILEYTVKDSRGRIWKHVNVKNEKDAFIDETKYYNENATS